MVQLDLNLTISTVKWGFFFLLFFYSLFHYFFISYFFLLKIKSQKKIYNFFLYIFYTKYFKVRAKNLYIL